ncbi:hypothetical protein [Aromatoleum diolicum]|uniref:Uncharacterized protein n=1 Tax=Aromatoleum diolicum TaxID=75796 RepID=A0ABX1Q9Z9_9RHOO|nr:hypothetical protein [Aromatoleum diolicum]NMG74009.1 hypothetical protein [Aromatoleum diolicum]
MAMNSVRPGQLAGLIALLVVGAGTPRLALPVEQDALERERFEQITVVDDEVLDGLRGGFETPGGLMLSFGIERLVYINGELLSTTSLNVADLGRFVGGSADAGRMPTLGSTVGLIQNGPNNTFDASIMASGAFATVIQNTLNDQTILSVTTINATVNSMDMMQANRIGDSLRSTVNSALFR